MFKRIFGEWPKKVIVPLARGLLRIGVTANMVTVAGFLVTLVAAGITAEGSLFWGGIVLLLGGVFDMLDGTVARQAGEGTKRGAFLDSTLDRLSDAAMFSALIWRYEAGPGLGWVVTIGPKMMVEPPVLGRYTEYRWGVPLALAAMILGFMVSYVRSRAEGLGIDCSVGWFGRAERLVILAVGLLLGKPLPFVAIAVLGSGATFVQRFVHVWHQPGVLEPPK
jgi:CDP-diacylglycerol---glycerol-3-phosphate 3-phosphatidyltransferase